MSSKPWLRNFKVILPLKACLQQLKHNIVQKAVLKGLEIMQIMLKKNKTKFYLMTFV